MGRFRFNGPFVQGALLLQQAVVSMGNFVSTVLCFKRLSCFNTFVFQRAPLFFNGPMSQGALLFQRSFDSRGPVFPRLFPLIARAPPLTPNCRHVVPICVPGAPLRERAPGTQMGMFMGPSISTIVYLKGCYLFKWSFVSRGPSV